MKPVIMWAVVDKEKLIGIYDTEDDATEDRDLLNGGPLGYRVVKVEVREIEG
jgi:hypothetical protein